MYLGLKRKNFCGVIVRTYRMSRSCVEVGASLEDRERRLLYEILFEEAQEPAWEEAQSCLDTLAPEADRAGLTDVHRGIEANPRVRQ